MGLKALNEELGEIIGSRPSSRCCGNPFEAIRALEQASGLEENVLLEAMKCVQECRDRHMDSDGSFKGGSGKAFESCKDMFSKCCKGVKDPEALCAYIGRRAGRI